MVVGVGVVIWTSAKAGIEVTYPTCGPIRQVQANMHAQSAGSQKGGVDQLSALGRGKDNDLRSVHPAMFGGNPIHLHQQTRQQAIHGLLGCTGRALEHGHASYGSAASIPDESAPRGRASMSIWSINRTEGAAARARANIRAMALSDSPTTVWITSVA